MAAQQVVVLNAFNATPQRVNLLWGQFIDPVDRYGNHLPRLELYNSKTLTPDQLDGLKLTPPEFPARGELLLSGLSVSGGHRSYIRKTVGATKTQGRDYVIAAAKSDINLQLGVLSHTVDFGPILSKK